MGLLTGLEKGLLFLVPAVLLLVAAALTAADAVDTRSSAGGPPEG